jgi:subtilase family serine protease
LLLQVAVLSAAPGQKLSGHVPAAVAASRRVGSVPRLTRMNLAVELPLRNPAELDNFLVRLADPADPNYRQYLTPEQFTERFGPSESDYQKLSDFLTARGMQVTGTHPNRTILDVAGSAADVETLLHVNLMRWDHPSRGEFFAPDSDPTIDSEVKILNISGLDNFIQPHPMSLSHNPLSATKSLATGSGPNSLFIGGDFRAAYAPGVTLTGSGQTVGLFELDGFYASDVAANFKRAGVTPVPVQTVLLDGFNGAPGSGNVEVTLDIMMAAYMAPGLSKIMVYEGTSPDDVLNRMATDNLAKQLSSSWGWDPTDAFTEQIFKQMIAQGQSLLQASGDDASYRGPIEPPSDDPNLTVVGGTSLSTAGAGGAWLSETSWPQSGGGVSTVWPLPSYQPAATMAAAGGSSKMRNIPDVSMIADVQIYLICNDGQGVSVGGTSAAAPLWAGFTALANQQAAAHNQAPVGFLNPSLYKIGATASYNTELHDITAGSNGGFKALNGYDLVTGWGTPPGQSLINALTGIANPLGFGLSLSSSTLTVVQGANGGTTVTINPQNGFTGNVALTVSGLPAGVTASFSSPSAATASTLTLTASSTATVGSATITITGTSGSLTGSAKLALAVSAPPSFTLAPATATSSVLQGATSSDAITISAHNGFTGTVALTASGLPPGVTASFTPASATSTSTVTFSATTTATAGATTVTVTGTSGSLHATATIGLTVMAPPPSFTVSAAPASITVATGGSGTSVIAVAPVNGFSGTVAFAASGLPAGVTAVFGTYSATAHTSTATFSASTSAAPGTTTVTVTATSGAISSKTSIAITVPVPAGFTLSAAPAALSVAAGASGGSTITVAPTGGFSGAVSLAVSGLPAGVTAALGSNSTKSTSTLTLTAASTATATTSTVTITGTSGVVTAKTTITLTVTPPPSFTLSATPTSVSVAPGASATTTIAVKALNSFAGAVGYAVSGLPTGATGTFSGSVLTVAVPKTAASGTSTVTITGTSGSLTAKTTSALTVAAPAPTFTLSASPAALSIATGSSGTSVLAVTPQNGFTGAVTMTVAGLPNGITGTFSGVTLTVSSTSSAVPGAATLTVTGKSGSLSATATIALTVVAANVGNTLVNLASLYNVAGLVADGATFTNGGLDGGGRAYSANLLGRGQTVGGTAFSWVPLTG